jgi:alkylation response protein AidB-like acyl-CoA dehydrogenase
MGTFSSALDRPLRTAAVIATEDEAITAAETIANVFDLRDESSGTAVARLDLLSRSGLLGISVPTEHGGIDVSNTILATICAEAAARSPALGEIVAAHFAVIEHVRTYGTEGQRNAVFSAALAGARLARAAPRRVGEDMEALALTASGLAWRLNGDALCTPCTRHADWILVPTRNEAGKRAGLLLPARIDGLRYVANTCEPTDGAQPPEQVLLKDVPVEGDTLLHETSDASRPAVPHALDLLLAASLQLGAARRAFAAAVDAPNAAPLTVGLFGARLAAADAMMAEGGRAIDAAQIGLADQHRTNAFLAAAAALAVAQEAGRTIDAVLAGQAEPGLGLSQQAVAALEESGRAHLHARRHPALDDA